MTTVALVAAKDSAGTIGATVTALVSLGVDEVWVVDDGSTDDTAAQAERAGARVVRLARNRGKGGALAAGLVATPHADRYLLADADLGATASGLRPLLEAPGAFVVGELPSAAGRGGFGAVKRLAAWGVQRAAGVTVSAPLSGQRVVDGALLRSLVLAPRFGVEVGMTIDAARRGAAVHEVPVAVDHAHRGRSIGGFVHRGRQGGDVAAALLPRLMSPALRVVGVLVAAALAFGALSVIAYVRRAPTGVALARADRVVLFAYDGLSLKDLNRAGRPALRAVMRRSAVGALSVRTSDRRSLSRHSNADRPSPADAYASLGASARVRAGADMAASRALARRDNADSLPGALGDALHAAHEVVTLAATTPPPRLAVADRRGRYVAGTGGNVTLVAPANDYDAALAAVVATLHPGDLLIVFSPTPPTKDWELTPILLAGDGVKPGSIASSTTHRAALAGLVDIAPTVLQALLVPVPAAMTGAPLRVSTKPANLAAYERLQVDGAARNRFFLPASVGYTVLAIVFYLAFMAAMRLGASPTVRRGLRVGACVAAAFPFALLVTGALQHWAHFGGESPGVLIAVTVALGTWASRWRGVGPVYVLAALCVVVIAVDVAATGPLHAASLLGYTIQVSGRYYGLPNASSSIFSSSLLLVAAALAGWEPTRVQATAAVAALAVGTAFLGAPWLANDVGGFVTLLPVTLAAAWALYGLPFTRRNVVLGAVTVGALIVAVGLLEAHSGGSHLGRVATETASNRRGLRTTLTRRVDANLGLLVDQWWGFGSLTLSVVGIALLTQKNRFVDYLPRRSGLRILGIGVLVTSIVGFLVNDSGPVVNVLCVVVLAPAMALTALAGPRSASGPASAP